MKISINEEYKSIKRSNFELPSFTVLTGKNGSGKTHLFEVMSQPQKCKISTPNIISQRTYIPFGKLESSTDGACNSYRVFSHGQPLYNSYLKNKNTAVQRFGSHRSLLSTENMLEKRIKEFESLFGHQKNVYLSICEKVNKNLLELTEKDIVNNCDFASDSTLFNSQFSLIFKGYHTRYLDNMLQKVMLDEGDVDKDDIEYLDKDSFEERYGEPPWDYLNRLLKILSLPYSSNDPKGSHRESEFQFKLVHIEKRHEISIQELSTGEKTLLSLAMAIYSAPLSNMKTGILILDEPDASLHPSMSKLMIEILYEEIWKKNKIPVIISTHSPITIACAPPNSIYKLTDEEIHPVQCTYDDSLDILTHGIPNLNVEIEDRRHVFVESNFDVKYYEQLFNILSRDNEFSTNLIFSSSHNRKGSNCTDVIEIVKKLIDSGISHIYGLIDWDLKNEGAENVVVLGNSKRYAIENYLFEPHLIGLLLIRNGFTTPSDLGLSKYNSYVEMSASLNESDLQNISDSVSSKLGYNPQSGNLENSTLIGGQTLKIPSELMKLKGHDLEDKYLEKWKELNAISKKTENLLKEEIIKTVIHEFPGLLSKDILETFNMFV